MPVLGDHQATEPTVFAKSRPDRQSSSMPALDVPDVDPAGALADALARLVKEVV